ncbi:MAG TPA: GNAT family N-acetyltransferase [Fimbriimonadaceae bacterium]|nr:GNAT family N-acetyltransferase [Fimbriimonadaceae bacterium]
MGIEVRQATAADEEWVRARLIEYWHGPMIERTDEFIDASELPALIAVLDARPAGLATVMLHQDHGEVMTLDSSLEGRGVGSALMTAAEVLVREAGLSEIRVFTANSNLNALGFYQRRGYRMWAIHRDTIARARAQKPEIPLYAENRIRNADEVELRKKI